ncbi:GlcG/HbpS family heme-binding protein [Brucella cytisi]|uniref:GlcG/HbpS family heme-binding protein n=1 Tax=Brucella cytisi TaxID=407152 RepID=UPI0035D9FCE2
MRLKQSIDLATAEKVIDFVSERATAMGVPQNIAVVDEAGHLVAFRRMDDAKFFSIDIAITKAFAASGARKATHEIAPATQPGMPGYGAQALLNGRFTTLGGGVPLTVDSGVIVGGLGISSGTVAQDTELATAAMQYFAEHLAGLA